MNWRFIIWQAVLACLTVVSVWILLPSKAEILQGYDYMKISRETESPKSGSAFGVKQDNYSIQDSVVSNSSAKAINQLTSRIDQLQEEISDLKNSIDALAKQKTSSFPPAKSFPPPAGMQGGGMPFPPPGNVPNPLGWLEKLPDYKKSRVQEAFKENAAMVRERIKTLPGGMSNRQQASEIIKQGNEDLNDRIEQILSPEEYEEYLRSMPALPPSPNNVGATK